MLSSTAHALLGKAGATLRRQLSKRAFPRPLSLLQPVLAVLASLLAFSGCHAFAQTKPSPRRITVTLTVVDENGIVVPDARVTLFPPGEPPVELHTDHAGRAQYTISSHAPYGLEIEKPGFYQQKVQSIDPRLTELDLTVSHEQIVRTQVNVVGSTSTIDPQQTADISTMNTPEIVNIPYPTNREIRNLLPFNPGVIQDETEQVHVYGSPTYATLDQLDGFDLRAPDTGALSFHVSTDAVRSIDIESSRYPVEYGKATGGVIAFSSGMGDNKFRFNATDFVPSFIDNQGIHFDKWEPRVTFSGPIIKDKLWYFDGFDLVYSSNFVPGLPSNADTDYSWQESNLPKLQVNLTPTNNLIVAGLFNDYHAPYYGLSTLTPQGSTYKYDIVAWLPYVRDQQLFSNGTLLDVGLGVTHTHTGSEPHGDTPYQITPQGSQGSYFENLTADASRVQESGALYISPRHWIGKHDFKAGLDLDQISFGQSFSNAPVSYLRENGTLLRLSTFSTEPPFTRQNADVGAYVQDRWQPHSGLMIEPGFRFDWDQIVRRPLYSPRLAGVYAPGKEPTTKLSAGIGVYYEHTQLSYIEEAFYGLRSDSYYAADGVTPVSPALPTTFVARYPLLRAPRVINWSVGIEQKLPWSIYADLNYVDKDGKDFFVYANQNPPPDLSGTYLLTNQRRLDYHAVNLTLRHTFRGNYVLYGAYTHSLAYTNAAIEYSPTIGYLGPQAPGPTAWNVPNRLISWGWLPVPKLKSWDFVYTVDARTGLPYTSVDSNYVVAGAPSSRDFPDYLSVSPGLEWKFHFRKQYWGLRGMIENITDRENPTVVNNVVTSPDYGQFTEPLGRAFTARLRLIGSK